MATSKNISTISYNTKEYLEDTLNRLIKEKKIQYWMYIKHDAEEDETKDHFHVFIQPNVLLDLLDLQYEFEEVNPANLNKPFRVMPFRHSDVDEWIPYALHDKGYLALKCESREYFYLKTDIVSSDEDYLDHLYRHAFKASKWAKDSALLNQIVSGELSPHELIDKGYVSMNMATQVNAYYYMKTHYGLDRNGRENHEGDF